MINLDEVKCIIWDLDMTLWDGVLLEGQVFLPEERKRLLQQIDCCGVIQTICSKNRFQDAKDKLSDFGIWDYFIAPMISYDGKAAQIQEFCRNMHFRFENCLFIDDHIANLEEVRYYCRGIQTCQEIDLQAFGVYYGDPERLAGGSSRRAYYRMLEMKHDDKKRYQSPADFLKNSQIRITIRKPDKVHFERIYQLIKRTNQLNFTKIRISRQELNVLLQDPDANNYCIHAFDRYGDYGVIGFVSIVASRAEHFLFSCRVLGMGIEQYVYQKFGAPQIEIRGDTAVTLGNELVDWIREVERADARERTAPDAEKRILLKGPCDIRSILSYFGNEEIFDTEFTYTNDRGIAIEQINHTFHAVQSLSMDKEKMEVCLGSLPFFDSDMYSGRMFSGAGYRAVCYSVITDSNLGVYRQKDTGYLVAFGEYCYPLTDPANWNDYICNVRFTANCSFTEEFLREFSEEYEFVGRISEDEFRKNLRTICSAMPPNCQLILMTGVELPYEKNTNENYRDRHLHHMIFRRIAEEVAAEFENVHTFSFAPYIKRQEDFLEHYNHFQKYVYYNVAADLVYLLRSLGIDEIQIISY